SPAKSPMIPRSCARSAPSAPPAHRMPRHRLISVIRTTNARPVPCRSREPQKRLTWSFQLLLRRVSLLTALRRTLPAVRQRAQQHGPNLLAMPLFALEVDLESGPVAVSP